MLGNVLIYDNLFTATSLCAPHLVLMVRLEMCTFLAASNQVSPEDLLSFVLTKREMPMKLRRLLTTPRSTDAP